MVLAGTPFMATDVVRVAKGDGLRVTPTGDRHNVRSEHFLHFPVQADDVLWKYLTIYTPVRLVEWLIVAWILRRTFAA